MIEHYLIGTYTKKTSQGVYSVDLDTDKKVLQNLHLVGKAGNPTYVTESNNKIVYAVDKITDKKTGDVSGGVLALDPNAGELPYKEVGRAIDEHPSPAYISVDEGRHLVYTANYHAGYISSYRIQKNGSVEIADQDMHKGTLGHRPEQQDGPHPHYVDLTPDNHIVSVDLGVDKVYLYNVDKDGKFDVVSELQMDNGYGPRHIVFSHTKDVAYLVGELSSHVAVLDYDRKNVKFSVKQIVSTIPSDWTAHNGAAAIRISKDDKFIYVSNRGNNSIVVFKIGDDDELELIQRISTEGDFPRDFNLSDDQSLLIASNQNSDNLVLYDRDAKTGKLSLISSDFKVPEPVCVARMK